jgi:hypothetical protein
MEERVEVYENREERKRTIKPIMPIVALGATIILAGGIYALNRGQKRFDGYLDGARVVYHENKGIFNRRNEMTVEKGDSSYRFIDLTDRTNLRFDIENSPEFSDRLERIVIYNGFRLTVNSDGTSSPGLLENDVQRFIDEGSRTYNHLRTEIWREIGRHKEDLRAMREEDIGEVPTAELIAPPRTHAIFLQQEDLEQTQMFFVPQDYVIVPREIFEEVLARIHEDPKMPNEEVIPCESLPREPSVRPPARTIPPPCPPATDKKGRAIEPRR